MNQAAEQRQTEAPACIQQLSQGARVSPGKRTPRRLRKLCQATRESMEQSISLPAEQTLGRLPERKRFTADWEEVNRP